MDDSHALLLAVALAALAVPPSLFAGLLVLAVWSRPSCAAPLAIALRAAADVAAALTRRPAPRERSSCRGPQRPNPPAGCEDERAAADRG